MASRRGIFCLDEQFVMIKAVHSLHDIPYLDHGAPSSPVFQVGQTEPADAPDKAGGVALALTLWPFSSPSRPRGGLSGILGAR